jgi:hypothetical protein
MLSSKSREHRMRVLQNQEKLAAELAQPRQQDRAQTLMPLIVEVKGGRATKQHSRRTRETREAHQTRLDDF